MSLRRYATGWRSHGQRPFAWLTPYGFVVAVMVLGVAAGWLLQPGAGQYSGGRSSQFELVLAIASLVGGTVTTSLLVVWLPRQRVPYASIIMLLEVVWIHLGRFAVPVSSWSAVAAALWAALLFASVMGRRRAAAFVTVLLGGLLTALLIHGFGARPIQLGRHDCHETVLSGHLQPPRGAGFAPVRGQC